MTRFDFDGEDRDHDGTTPKGASIVDHLIAAAGGAPLPGAFGLAQAVFDVWSRDFPHPGTGPFGWSVYVGRSALNTAGIVRQFADDEKPMQEVESPIDRYIRDNKLVIPRDLAKLGGMIFPFAYECLPHVDYDLSEEDGNRLYEHPLVRKFTTEDGLELSWVYHRYDPKFDDGASANAPANGPYVLASRAGEASDAVRKLIWSRYDGDIQLEYDRTDVTKAAKFALTSIGAVEPHIEDDSGGATADMALRCRAMAEKSIPRRIMLYGPPGTGKSSSARALAALIGGEENGRTLRIDPGALGTAGAGRVMEFVRLLKPTVVLFDDIDRTNQVLSLLRQMEDSKRELPNTTIIGTVNAISEVDPAMLRPGRFDEVRLVGPPGPAQRLRIIQHYAKFFGVYNDISGIEDALCEEMDEMTPAEIREVFSTSSVVGMQYMSDEIHRVKVQSGLYSGDSVDKYLRRHQ